MDRRIKGCVVYSKVWLWILIGIFLALSCWYLSLPGLNFDECLGAAPAVVFLKGANTQPMQIDPSVIHIFSRPLPVMIMPYIGPVKTLLHIPVYFTLGISPVTTRLMPVILIGMSLLLFFMAVQDETGEGLKALALLVVHPVITIYLIRDVAPAAFAVFALSVVLWGFLNYYQTQRLQFLFLAALFAGLGVSHKVDFVWLIVSLILSIAVTYPVKLRLKDYILSLFFFLLGALPIVVFNLVTNFLTWRMLSHKFEMASMFDSLLIRFKQFFQLLSGDFISRYFVGIKLDKFYVATIVAICCFLFLLKPKTQLQRLLGLTILFFVFFSSLSQFALHIHHLLVIIPLVLIYLALQYRQWTLILFGLFLFGSIELNLNLKETKGVGVWASVVNQIAEDSKNYKGLNLYTRNYTESLIVLTQGQLNGRRIYQGELPEPDFANLYAGELPKGKHYLDDNKVVATLKAP